MASRIKPKYLRITAMLYPFSGMKDVPKHYLDEASERGSKVHEIISAQEAGLGLTELNKNYIGYIHSYELWVKDKKFLKLPERFYCDELMLTGEIDAIYEDESGIVIVDYKTSSKESKTWPIQASAYSYLAKKAGYKIARVEFVKLSKEGKDPEVFVYEEDMQFVRELLKCYRYFFKEETEKNPIDYI